MKKILIILLSIIALASCQSNTCVIEGTVLNSNLNGKRVFLVPVFYEDSLGVDSVVIKDNKFKFERNEEYLADIRIDYHYRYGTENLLVITEPGNVKVVIDSTSHGGGTPQNDSLQCWKELVMKRFKDLQKYQKEYATYMSLGDTLNATISKKNTEIIMDQFNKRTKKMADNLQSGTLYEFLMQRVPKDN